MVPSDLAYDKNAHLSIDDVLVDNVSSPRWLEIRIKASKTDPFRKGISIFIGKNRQQYLPSGGHLGL